MSSSLSPTIATGHSATVRMHAVAKGQRFEVAQVGPDFMIATESIELPPTTVDLVVQIDGQEKRRRLYLPDGVRKTVTRTPIKCA